MGWVVKMPKRADFCGCEGCPLCFDWAQDMEFKIEVEEELPDGYVVAPEQPVVAVISGVEKMALDLLGRPATNRQREELTKAAYKIHEDNKARATEYQDKINEAAAGRSAEAVIKAKIKERSPAVRRKDLNTVNIDNMEENRVKELCGATAPVDQELLAREPVRSR